MVRLRVSTSTFCNNLYWFDFPLVHQSFSTTLSKRFDSRRYTLKLSALIFKIRQIVGASSSFYTPNIIYHVFLRKFCCIDLVHNVSFCNACIFHFARRKNHIHNQTKLECTKTFRSQLVVLIISSFSNQYFKPNSCPKIKLRPYF